MELMLSVCVVTYNHEKYIKECINSILAQDMKFDYEILVGDDCSTDETVKQLQEYKDKIKIIQRCENLGLCANTYDLFMRAKGKYVFTIAGDDYLYGSHILRKHVEFLEENAEYYMVSGWNYLLDMHSGELRKCNYCSNEMDYSLRDFLLDSGVIVAEGTMRNTFVEDKKWNGFLCEGAKNNEEMKLWFYILNKGKINIRPEQFYVYRYVNKKGEASNYNSTHTTAEMFKDYYVDLTMLRSKFGKQYNFNLLILHLSNKFLIMSGAKIGDMYKVLSIMKVHDVFRLLLYKIYLKTHSYEEPKWSRVNLIKKEGSNR